MAPVMLRITDTDGRCVYFNKQWYDYTGHAPDTGLGCGWLEALHPDDRAACSYIASHDLQEPLRKIRMFTDLLSRSRHDAERFDLYLRKIDSSANRMSTLIKDVLNYSTLLMNKARFVKVDLNEIARETLGGLASWIFDENAKITVGSLPIVRGVDSQLLLLFNNIVANSLAFTEGSPAIKINAVEIAGKNISNLGADPMQTLCQDIV